MHALPDLFCPSVDLDEAKIKHIFLAGFQIVVAF